MGDGGVGDVLWIMASCACTGRTSGGWREEKMKTAPAHIREVQYRK